jgi:hypothetical protein
MQGFCVIADEAVNDVSAICQLCNRIVLDLDLDCVSKFIWICNNILFVHSALGYVIHAFPQFLNLNFINEFLEYENP